MKTLTLLRHAKSGWDDPALRDFDRSLNRRGRRAAATVGREMKRLGLQFDLVIASPAVRVVETLDGVAEGFGRSLSPQFDKRLYLASLDVLLEIVHEAPPTVDRLLLVGHNPGLERLALHVTSGEGARAEVAIKYPTATLAEIHFGGSEWADICESGGTIERFIRPRDLDPELGPDEDSD